MPFGQGSQSLDEFIKVCEAEDASLPPLTVPRCRFHERQAQMSEVYEKHLVDVVYAAFPTIPSDRETNIKNWPAKEMRQPWEVAA